jgi:hypothetical protein
MAKLDPGMAKYSCPGKWRVAGKELIQEEYVTDGKLSPWIIFGDKAWKDYDLRLTALKFKGDTGFHIAFDHTHTPIGWKHTQWQIGIVGNKLTNVATWDHRGPVDRTAFLKCAVQAGRWYEILVRLRGEKVQCYLDNNLMFTFNDPGRRGGKVGIGCVLMTGRFRDIEIKSPDGTVLWEGPPTLPDGVDH